RLKQYVSGLVSMILMVGGSVAILLLLALLVQSSVVALTEDLPRLENRARNLIEQGQQWMHDYVPSWLSTTFSEDPGAQKERAKRIETIALGIANVAWDFLVEIVIVIFYLVFLLLEVSRFPRRVRKSFVNDQADQILGIVGNINNAIADYLRVKVKASL